jgi:hypothetical protein
MVNRNRDLPACSIVPQPTTLPRAPTRCLIPILITYCPTFRNVELHNIYTSPYINRMIQSWRMSWEGYVARLVEMNGA